MVNTEGDGEAIDNNRIATTRKIETVKWIQCHKIFQIIKTYFYINLLLKILIFRKGGEKNGW